METLGDVPPQETLDALRDAFVIECMEAYLAVTSSGEGV